MAKAASTFQVGQVVYLKEPNAYGGEVDVVAVSQGSICVQLRDLPI